MSSAQTPSNPRACPECKGEGSPEIPDGANAEAPGVWMACRACKGSGCVCRGSRRMAVGHAGGVPLWAGCSCRTGEPPWEDAGKYDPCSHCSQAHEAMMAPTHRPCCVCGKTEHPCWTKEVTSRIDEIKQGDCLCTNMTGGRVARCLRCFLLCCNGDPDWNPAQAPEVYVQLEVRDAARRLLEEEAS